MTIAHIDQTLAQVEELVTELLNEEPLAGLAVGIVQGDELVYAKGFGLADIKEQKPVTPDTVFRIGSISKTFTAIALMQLWEQGRFELDDPVNDYLKAYTIYPASPDAPQVTFRHLLTHTGGIGELRSWTDLFRPVIGLVLQPHLFISMSEPLQPTFVVTPSCSCLVPSSPDGPVQGPLQRWWRPPDQCDEQAPHFRHRQREQFDIELESPPFWPSFPTAWARVTVRKACANNANVLWRYHPIHFRTSYWSSPTSPLAVSRLSSTAQRVPATCTSVSSVVSAGAQAR